ncbi:MAG: beta-glucosidase family protein [Opitutaceae bacterium]
MAHKVSASLGPVFRAGIRAPARLAPWVLAGACLLARAAAAPPPYRDPRVPVEQRVADALARLTLDEKIELLSGYHWFSIAPIPRLGLPEIRMSDGPLGIRSHYPSTAYPSTEALAASWDRALARDYGVALGRDARARGIRILLAPAINIVRIPQNGRNFEFMSEDPVLTADIAVPEIQGIQSQGVVATVKHFVAHNQGAVVKANVLVGERALREIYLPAFKAAVERGHAWAVMDAYNRINGSWCTEDNFLNNRVLKGEWHFPGIVMSDWLAAHDDLAEVDDGLDLEMPGPVYYTAKRLKHLLAGRQISLATLDDKVRRILRLEIANGFLDHPIGPDPSIPANDPRSSAVALRIAREGIVLLKNRGKLLPLDRARMKSVVVLGPNCRDFPQGGGSSLVKAFHFVSVLEGLRRAAGPVAVTYVPADGSAPDFVTAADARVIRSADAVVVCVGFNSELEREGSDRTYALPGTQPELIRAVAALNPRTIVILDSGGNVAMADWIGRVPALLEAWYPGQEGGRALAGILFGDSDPSGRLPVTFEKRWKDHPAYLTYPPKGDRSDLAEGVFMGYRSYDARGIAPRFPFGFGLSYTTFAFSGLRVTRAADGDLRAAFSVANTGGRAGAEVAQVYVAPPPGPVARPVRELKAFARVSLAPGQTKRVSVVIERGSLAYFDEGRRAWTTVPGDYVVSVGSSSRSLPESATVTLP